MKVLPGTIMLPQGIKVGHVWSDVYALYKVIDRYKIKNFIEIGVHEGGLCWLLLERFPNLNYLGIEINLPITLSIVRSKVNVHDSAELLWADCFEASTIQTVREWMPDEPCLIYCDNGDKPKEVRQYAPLLRVGDILMVHDYHDGRRVVKGLRGYGYDLDFPKPEVYPEDVDFMRKTCDELDKVDFFKTRIIGFIKR